jgi:hypothetical protein
MIKCPEGESDIRVASQFCPTTDLHPSPPEGALTLVDANKEGRWQGTEVISRGKNMCTDEEGELSDKKDVSQGRCE